MKRTMRNQALLIVVFLLPLIGCAGGSYLALNVSGSFVVTKCEANRVLLVQGVAGKHLIGETVEIFNGDRKIAEAGTVGPNGTFDVSVSYPDPQPFKPGDLVTIRIGEDVGQAVASDYIASEPEEPLPEEPLPEEK